MSALAPVDAAEPVWWKPSFNAPKDEAECLSKAAECERRAEDLARIGAYSAAGDEQASARHLRRWAIKFKVSARGSTSNAESAGEVDSSPISPAAISHSLPPPTLSQQATDRPDAPQPHPASGQPFESDSPKSRPGDAAASLTQQSNSPRQERPSAQERSSDRSGGQFGDAPKPAHIPGTAVQP